MLATTTPPRDRLAALRSRDERAFADLVDDAAPRLFAVARRILGNEEDARDAVQDAYVSVLENLDRFQGGSAVLTWVYRIVVNAALMRLRRRRRSKEVALAPIAEVEDPSGSGVGHGLESRELAGLLRDGIDRLPRDYRDVLRLRVLEERDTKSTAEELGISTQAVKTRLHRARGALRTLLEPQVA